MGIIQNYIHTKTLVTSQDEYSGYIMRNWIISLYEIEKCLGILKKTFIKNLISKKYLIEYSLVYFHYETFYN